VVGEALVDRRERPEALRHRRPDRDVSRARHPPVLAADGAFEAAVHFHGQIRSDQAEQEARGEKEQRRERGGKI
jgi:hypothetical protein